MQNKYSITDPGSSSVNLVIYGQQVLITSTLVQNILFSQTWHIIWHHKYSNVRTFSIGLGGLKCPSYFVFIHIQIKKSSSNIQCNSPKSTIFFSQESSHDLNKFFQSNALLSLNPSSPWKPQWDFVVQSNMELFVHRSDLRTAQVQDNWRSVSFSFIIILMNGPWETLEHIYKYCYGHYHTVQCINGSFPNTGLSA